MGIDDELIGSTAFFGIYREDMDWEDGTTDGFTAAYEGVLTGWYGYGPAWASTLGVIEGLVAEANEADLDMQYRLVDEGLIEFGDGDAYFYPVVDGLWPAPPGLAWSIIGPEDKHAGVVDMPITRVSEHDRVVRLRAQLDFWLGNLRSQTTSDASDYLRTRQRILDYEDVLAILDGGDDPIIIRIKREGTL